MIYRSFWKTIVTLFLKTKNPKKQKFNLNEEGKNVNGELCRICNNYFSEVISNLKIPSLIKNAQLTQMQ